MDLKYDTNLNNQKLKDEIEMTKLQGEALQGSINELKKKTKMDKEISKKDYDKRSRQVASTLRTQVKTKEESANLAMIFFIIHIKSREGFAYFKVNSLAFLSN